MSTSTCFELAVPEHGGAIRVHHDRRAVSRVELLEPRSRRDSMKCRGPSGRFEERIAAHVGRYFAGEPVRFDLPVDLDDATAFQRAVWEALRTIPHGEVRTYGWVAHAVGRPRAARAVGAACRANRVPILVPCHRVVAGDGSLGGFSAGVRWKRFLLELERTPLGAQTDHE